MSAKDAIRIVGAGLRGAWREIADAKVARLAQAAFRSEGGVLAVEGASFVRVAGLDAFANDWFTLGRGEGAPDRGGRSAPGALAADARARGGTRFVCRDRGLRQAIRDLPHEVCERCELPRLPAPPGQRLRRAYAVPGEPGHDGSPVR
jgi:hypothetical protein